MIRPGDAVRTMLFGVVEINEVFDREEEARAAGYCYDAHAYLVNIFGGIEPVAWKVLAKSVNMFERVFCAVILRRIT